MFFRVLGLVVGLTAGQLAVALAGGHGLRSEVAALKAPRSDNGQHGDVRSPTFINTTITDSTGADASSRLKVLHYYHSANNLKRAPSRVIDWCVPPKICVRSMCRRYVNAQGYGILCRQPGGVVILDIGSCQDNEICVESRQHGLGVAGVNVRAYCVSMQNFVSIANAHPVARIVTRAEGARDGPRSVAVEAVMTAPDGMTLMHVGHLSLHAKEVENVNALAGHTACDGCSSVRLDPVPPGTMQVENQVVVQGTAAGSLYLLVEDVGGAG